MKSAFDGDVKYDAVTEELKLWPNKTVPYTFNCSFNAEGKAAVKVAMQEISDKTCLRFVKRDKVTGNNTPFTASSLSVPISG